MGTKPYLKVLIAILAVVIFSNSINFSSAYFGDLTININQKGEVTTTGETDCKELSNLNNALKFTSVKNNKILVNITSQCFFESINYEIRLPKNTLLNYFKSSTRFVITSEKESLIIKSSDSSKKLEILIQFSTIDTNQQNLFLIIFITTTILLTISSLWLFIKQKDSIKTIKEELSERQKQIIEILFKEKSISQAELTKRLQLPKSSISRNINSLLRRGIILKEKKTKTNLIRINPEYLKNKIE